MTRTMLMLASLVLSGLSMPALSAGTLDGGVPSTIRVGTSAETATSAQYYLSGTVYERLPDGTRRTLAGAVVTLTGPNISTTTGANGRFSFPNLVAGIYNVTVTAPGHDPVTRRLSLPTNNEFAFTLPVTVSPGSGVTRTVQGVLLGANGAGVSGATIRLTPGNVSAVTDAAGNFTFTNLAAGTYAAHITAPGMIPMNRRVTIGSSGNVSISVAGIGKRIEDRDDDDDHGAIKGGNGRGRGNGHGKGGKHGGDD